MENPNSLPAGVVVSIEHEGRKGLGDVLQHQTSSGPAGRLGDDHIAFPAKFESAFTASCRELRNREYQFSQPKCALVDLRVEALSN